MDREVLSDPWVREYLGANFELVSVYNLDSLTHVYRRRYNVSTNPCFLFLSPQGEVLHRLVGFLGKEDLLRECEQVLEGKGLSWMDGQYASGRRDPEFLADYIAARDHAALLDSAVILNYFTSLRERTLREPVHFSNLLRYGYTRDKIWIPYGSKWHLYLKKSYEKGDFPELREALRSRLLFTVYDHIKAHPDDIDISRFIEELTALENGQQNAIKDLDGGRYYRFIEDRYPSYTFQYERLLAKGDREGITALNERYSGKPAFRPIIP